MIENVVAYVVRFLHFNDLGAGLEHHFAGKQQLGEQRLVKRVARLRQAAEHAAALALAEGVIVLRRPVADGRLAQVTIEFVDRKFQRPPLRLQAIVFGELGGSIAQHTGAIEIQVVVITVQLADVALVVAILEAGQGDLSHDLVELATIAFHPTTGIGIVLVVQLEAKLL